MTRKKNIASKKENKESIDIKEMKVGDKVIDLENNSELLEISDVNDDNINSSSAVEDEIIEETKFEVEKLLGTEVPERRLNLKSFGRDMMT